MNKTILIYGGEKNKRIEKVNSYLTDKLKKDFHPDILKIEIEKDKKSIGIKEVSGVDSFLRIKPFSEKEKVVIIYDSEFLTEEAQNSLLKILEEAPKYSKIILEASSLRKFLETVKSRCILIYVPNENEEKETNTAKAGDSIKRKKFLSMNPEERLEWVDLFSKKEKEEILIELHLIAKEIKEEKNKKIREGYLRQILEFIENYTKYNLNSKICLLNFVLKTLRYRD
jgi:DNA polymerase-3 subunit delta'